MNRKMGDKIRCTYDGTVGIFVCSLGGEYYSFIKEVIDGSLGRKRDGHIPKDYISRGTNTYRGCHAQDYELDDEDDFII